MVATAIVKDAPVTGTAPASLDALQQLVRSAAASGRRIRAVSLDTAVGRPTGGVTTLDLSGLVGLQALDAAANTATFLAGTTVADAVAILAARDLTLVGAPADDTLTLAQAAAFGARGTSPKLAIFSGELVGLTLVDGAGRVRHFTSGQDPELWGAVRLTRGELGVIAAVTVRTSPRQVLQLHRNRTNLRTLVREFDQARAKVDHYRATWRPGHDGAVLNIGWLTAPKDAPAQDAGALRSVSTPLALAPASPATPASSTALALRPAHETALVRTERDHPGFFGRLGRALARLVPAKGTGNNRARPLAASRPAGRRGTQPVTLEYAFAQADAAAAITALNNLAKRSGRGFAGARASLGLVAGDTVWLSPSYGRDSVTIALTLPDTPAAHTALAQAEYVFITHRGLPNWSTAVTFTDAEARDVMPRYVDFDHARHNVDPGGVFVATRKP